MENKSLSKCQIFIMAISAGICVANIYYSQPIFHEIAESFNVEAESIGLMAVLSQAGYGFGLFFITPLGDKVDRRSLIIVLEICLALALVVITITTNLTVLYLSGFCIGLFAVAAQVILPMAASMVSENRGKIVGVIFTGILIGVLLSRLLSGYISIWVGWRYIYGISSLLVLLSAFFIYTNFPKASNEPFRGTYKDLLASTIHQFVRFKGLRRTSLIGALTFGTFSSFWLVLTFHLGASPFNFHSDTIGLFGILAIAGILLVPLFGKLADKEANPKKPLSIAIIAVSGGLSLLISLPYSLLFICLAIVLIDLGVQAAQVTNIAFIYTLDQSANSRINTVYMTSYFIGGASGAYLSLLCWHFGGWNAVMALMTLFMVIAFVVVRLSGKPAASTVNTGNPKQKVSI